MAVEAGKSGDRQIVEVTWDMGIVTGEIVQLHCVNPENGDKSQSGLSKNDGQGFVTYPTGYSGKTEVTVYDNDGNADFGVIAVGDAPTEPPVDPGEPVYPAHPIVLPPDSDLHPEHPIVLPPEAGPDDPHPAHPIVIPPDAFPEHPIVLPPDVPSQPPVCECPV